MIALVTFAHSDPRKEMCVSIPLCSLVGCTGSWQHIREISTVCWIVLTAGGKNRQGQDLKRSRVEARRQLKWYIKWSGKASWKRWRLSQDICSMWVIWTSGEEHSRQREEYVLKPWGRILPEEHKGIAGTYWLMGIVVGNGARDGSGATSLNASQQRLWLSLLVMEDATGGVWAKKWHDLNCFLAPEVERAVKLYWTRERSTQTPLKKKKSLQVLETGQVSPDKKNSRVIFQITKYLGIKCVMLFLENSIIV